MLKGKSAKISVIVPVFNLEGYIGKCIESIISQTYGNLEIILVDDFSMDNSFCVCQEYANIDSRIKLIRNDENMGVSYSRNRAINIATGDYVFMVDGDDWIDVNCIEIMLEAIEQNEADICVCGYVREHENSNSSECLKIVNEKKIEKCRNILNYAMQKERPFVGYIWAKMYRLDIIKAINLRFDTKISLCEDSIFNYKYLDCAKKCVVIEECLYHYLIRQQSATRTATAHDIKTKLVAFQQALEIAKKYPYSLFYYRMYATTLETTMQYINSILLANETIAHDEFIAIMKIAGKSYKNTKIKYISMGALVRYYMFSISPKIARLVIQTKKKVRLYGK